MKKIKKKWIVVIVVVVILSILGIKMMSKDNTPQTIVEVNKVSRGDLQTLVEVKGEIEANDSAEITSAYNYEVISIGVKEGDKVQKGQILATLDSKTIEDEITILKKEIEYDILRLKEGYSEVSNIYKSTEGLKLSTNNAKLSEDNAKLAAENAKNALDTAIKNEQKQQELYNADAIARQELDSAIDAKNQAQISYNQALVAYEQAKVAYSQAKEAEKRGIHDIKTSINQATPKKSAVEAINIKKQTLVQKIKRLEDLKIKAPITGTVTRVYAKIGRNAQDTQDHKPMFVIEDESKKFLLAKIGEYDISNIKLGQEVSISADVLGKEEVKGIVDRISPTGEKSSTSNNIVIPIKILLTQSDSRLITGVTAKAKIKTNEEKSTLKVPFESIYNQDGKNYLLVIDNDTIKKIEVRTGLESSFETQIISPDIKEGMSVVKIPDETMTDGTKVVISDGKDNVKKEEDKK